MRKVDVLGTEITAGALPEVADELERMINTRDRGFVCFTNVHVVMAARRSPELSGALAHATFAFPDGAPVAWLARQASGAPVPRIAGSDVFDELCRRSVDRGHRHFFFGSTPQTLERLRRALMTRYPGLSICGMYSPPFGPLSAEDVRRHCSLIDEARPDVVWVGLGAPKQELWMEMARRRLEAPVLAGVGAVFDFFSGTKTRAPRALQRAGLEWLHRLAHEPRRLAVRYLTTNTSFVALVAVEAARGRLKAPRRRR